MLLASSAAQAQPCRVNTGRRTLRGPVVRAAVSASSTSASWDSDNNDRSVPPPLGVSFFLPYKSLPPNGQIIPPHEETCDIEVTNCKSLAYVYETQCTCCSGTGMARSRRSSGGRGRSRRVIHGSLHTCVVCKGMGHVRRTTGRFTPDVPADIQQATLARQQKLPGEPEHQLPAPQPGQERPSRLQKAKELFEKLTRGTKHATTEEPQSSSHFVPERGSNGNEPSTNGNGNGGNGGPAPVPGTGRVQNNIVTSKGRLSAQPTSQEVKQGASTRQ